MRKGRGREGRKGIYREKRHRGGRGWDGGSEWEGEVI